jgi:hypothetical protein
MQRWQNKNPLSGVIREDGKRKVGRDRAREGKGEDENEEEEGQMILWRTRADLSRGALKKVIGKHYRVQPHKKVNRCI